MNLAKKLKALKDEGLFPLHLTFPNTEFEKPKAKRHFSIPDPLLFPNSLLELLEFPKRIFEIFVIDPDQ